MSLLPLLIQFVFRVTFGVALAMSVTPPRWVSSGFYRVHLWVLMGLNTLAVLSLYTQRDALAATIANVPLVLGLALFLAVSSYVGAALWLYEKTTAGMAVLVMLVIVGLCAAAGATYWAPSMTQLDAALSFLNLASSGILIGVTLSAMFLGHWYLNVPNMELRPLKRLVTVMGSAIVTRAVISGTGLILLIGSGTPSNETFWILVTLRWLAGLIGTFFLAVLTWYTLKVPNTQSATGILYASVILAFIGELTSQFLSANALHPL